MYIHIHGNTYPGIYIYMYTLRCLVSCVAQAYEQARSDRLLEKADRQHARDHMEQVGKGRVDSFS